MNDPMAAADFAPAGNGRDRLNNLEEVVVNDPIPGSGLRCSKGFNVAMRPQELSLIGVDPVE